MTSLTSDKEILVKSRPTLGFGLCFYVHENEQIELLFIQGKRRIFKYLQELELVTDLSQLPKELQQLNQEFEDIKSQNYPEKKHQITYEFLQRNLELFCNYHFYVHRSNTTFKIEELKQVKLKTTAGWLALNYRKSEGILYYHLKILSNGSAFDLKHSRCNKFFVTGLKYECFLLQNPNYIQILPMLEKIKLSIISLPKEKDEFDNIIKHENFSEFISNNKKGKFIFMFIQNSYFYIKPIVKYGYTALTLSNAYMHENYLCHWPKEYVEEFFSDYEKFKLLDTSIQNNEYVEHFYSNHASKQDIKQLKEKIKKFAIENNYLMIMQ